MRNRIEVKDKSMNCMKLRTRKAREVTDKISVDSEEHETELSYVKRTGA